MFLKPTSASATACSTAALRCPGVSRHQTLYQVCGVAKTITSQLTAYSKNTFLSQRPWVSSLSPAGLGLLRRKVVNLQSRCQGTTVSSETPGSPPSVCGCRLNRGPCSSKTRCSASRVSPRFLVRWSSVKMAAFFIEPGRKQVSNSGEDVRSARSHGRRARAPPASDAILLAVVRDPVAETPLGLDSWSQGDRKYVSAFNPLSLEVLSLIFFLCVCGCYVLFCFTKQ